MSFATEVKTELLTLPLKRNCCRKAFLCGLLYHALCEQDKTLCIAFADNSQRALASEMLSRQFAAVGSAEEVTQYGRKKYLLRVRSKAIFSFFAAVEHGEMIDIAASFQCADCAGAFLRGAFISCATINDPHKGYHMEFSLPAMMEERLNALYALLSRCGFSFKRVDRKTKLGVYCKVNSTISDALYYIGAVKTGFEFANGCIEKDIRNYENRATNCVATNISKSVSASQKHIAAIRRLERAGQLQALSDELYETAMLRLFHEEATLTELALLHQPPISKSGLNHRLQKICSFAETVTPVI